MKVFILEESLPHFLFVIKILATVFFETNYLIYLWSANICKKYRPNDTAVGQYQQSSRISVEKSLQLYVTQDMSKCNCNVVIVVSLGVSNKI